MGEHLDCSFYFMSCLCRYMVGLHTLASVVLHRSACGSRPLVQTFSQTFPQHVQTFLQTFLQTFPICAWLASFFALSQGSCRSFLDCLCISCKVCWTSYFSSQAYRHNHTHTYTIIHADAREDMHTYNRTILGGQIRKSLVLWGTIQIRM